MPISYLKKLLFRILYHKKGYPVSIGNMKFRVDETLRRWNFDAEHELRDIFHRILKSGDNIFDIGANFGLHSVYMVRLVGETGHIFAFEPIPKNLRLLKANIALNGMQKNLTVVECAISGSGDKTIKMNLPSDDVAVSASIIKKQGSNNIIDVKNKRLDDFVSEHKIIPDFIKIDVEGAEMEVLKGAKNILIKYRPYVLIEIHVFALRDFNASPEEISLFFKNLGYKEQRISETKGSAGDYFHSLFSYVNPN